MYARGAVAALLLLTACGGNTPGEADPEAKAGSEVTIVATDFAFEVSPETIPAGEVETTLKNEGKEPHQAGYYLLNEGVTYEEFASTIIKDDSQIPQLATGGRMGYMRSLSGGDTGVRPSDELPRGTYAVLCSIRDPNSGKNHYELGMIARLTVE